MEKRKGNPKYGFCLLCRRYVLKENFDDVDQICNYCFNGDGDK